jgi:zinc transport system permease protein
VLSSFVDQLAGWLTQLAPPGTFLSNGFNVRGLMAVVLVSLVCGAVGSLVVGNRMAFFSDALAHVAFAGAVLGCLLALAAGVARHTTDFDLWIVWVMTILGVLVGLAIRYVREKSNLASDTVIGVFFAGAIGVGALLFKLVQRTSRFSPETFIFGHMTGATAEDIVNLFFLLVVTLVLLALAFNTLVFSSFNPSLARARRLPTRLSHYAFIALLALIVNLSFMTVGVLLITGLLVVPAATAANLSRNVRQQFWLTVTLSLVCGVAGDLLSWELEVWTRQDIFGPSGTILVLSVLLFFLTLALGRRGGSQPAG